MNCHHNRQRSTRCILDRFLPTSSFQMLADLSIHTQTWAVPPATLHLAASVTTRIGLTQFLFETVAHLHRCFLFFFTEGNEKKKRPHLGDLNLGYQYESPDRRQESLSSCPCASLDGGVRSRIQPDSQRDLSPSSLRHSLRPREKPNPN
jgi:hypothetical protein